MTTVKVSWLKLALVLCSGLAVASCARAPQMAGHYSGSKSINGPVVSQSANSMSMTSTISGVKLDVDENGQVTVQHRGKDRINVTGTGEIDGEGHFTAQVSTAAGALTYAGIFAEKNGKMQVSGTINNASGEVGDFNATQQP